MIGITAAVFAFYSATGLDQKRFKGQHRSNHATLAGLDFEHEVAAGARLPEYSAHRQSPGRSAAMAGTPTSFQNKWAQELVACIRAVGRRTRIHEGGGIQFDAKLRRQSVESRRTCIWLLISAAWTTISRGQLLGGRDKLFGEWAAAGHETEAAISHGAAKLGRVSHRRGESTLRRDSADYCGRTGVLIPGRAPGSSRTRRGSIIAADTANTDSTSRKRFSFFLGRQPEISVSVSVELK